MTEWGLSMSSAYVWKGADGAVGESWALATLWLASIAGRKVVAPHKTHTHTHTGFQIVPLAVFLFSRDWRHFSVFSVGKCG